MSPIPTRQLGKDGPQVPALGFGLMGLSAFYGATSPDEERLRFLDHVHASGETFWDTADVYMDSEDLIGKYVSSFSCTHTKSIVSYCLEGLAPCPDQAMYCIETSSRPLSLVYLMTWAELLACVRPSLP